MKTSFLGATYQVKIWSGETPGYICACDTETTIVNNLRAEVPELVTFQYFDGHDSVYYVRSEDIELFLEKAKQSHLVFHNIAFDWAVIDKHLGAHFAMNDWLESSRIHDTQLLERLRHLAVEGFVAPLRKTGLAHLIKERFGVELDKDNDIRMGFSPYLNQPLENIPVSNMEYGALDVIATYYLYQALIQDIQETGSKTLLSEQIQIAGTIGISTMMRNGIGFDLERREQYVVETEAKINALQGQLANWGLVRGIPGYNTAYGAIIELLGLPLPKTDTGIYSSKEEDLRPYRASHSFVDAFLTHAELEKELSFVKNLTERKIHAKYDNLKNTGRTGCSQPNMQNLPRKGGIREMFVPVTPGNVFVDIDYSSLELAVLSQICYSKFGESRMRELINSGECLHYATAVEVFGKPRKEITKEERQFAKIPNFGFPANMSENTFIEYAAGYGVDVDYTKAEASKKAFKKAYPEMVKFWDVGYGALDSWTLTGRKRANCTYTAFLNTQFQGLAADGAKIAMYYITKAGYRLAAFIHDQMVVECAPSDAPKVLEEVSKIMIDGMKTVCPDVNIEVEGQIIERFCK